MCTFAFRQNLRKPSDLHGTLRYEQSKKYSFTGGNNDRLKPGFVTNSILLCWLFYQQWKKVFSTNTLLRFESIGGDFDLELLHLAQLTRQCTVAKTRN